MTAIGDPPVYKEDKLSRPPLSQVFGTQVFQEDRAEVNVTLSDIWNSLDADGGGNLTEEEFIDESVRLAPAINHEDAAEVFHLLDLDGGGSISRAEFDVIFSGMTFAGQALDTGTVMGKWLRSNPCTESLSKERKVTSRLAMKLERKLGHQNQGSSESKRRARQSAALFITRRIRAKLQRRREAAAGGKEVDQYGAPSLLDVAMAVRRSISTADNKEMDIPGQVHREKYATEDPLREVGMAIDTPISIIEVPDVAANSSPRDEDV
jgi:hypothetical protein